MGHDIYALSDYVKWDNLINLEENPDFNKAKKYEIAYLRFGMNTKEADEFYLALHCENFNNHWSGCGYCVWISINTINDARYKSYNDPDSIKFLDKVFSYMKEHNLTHIEIAFY